MVGSALPNMAWIGLDPQIIRWYSRARNIAAMKMSQFVDKVTWVTFGFFPELSEGEISAGNPYFIIYLFGKQRCFSILFRLDFRLKYWVSHLSETVKGKDLAIS